MQEMINTRKASEKKEERHDLFTLLLDANMEEDETGESPAKLTDSELIGMCDCCYYSK
jgi:cytochrome P450